MTGPPHGTPPPEKEAAALAGTKAADRGSQQNQNHDEYNTTDPDKLALIALAVGRGGELSQFVPATPEWHRRVGSLVYRHLAARRGQTECRNDATRPGHGLEALDLERLRLVYRLALARRRGAEVGP